MKKEMKSLVRLLQGMMLLVLLMCPMVARADEDKAIGAVDIKSITKYTEGDGWSWDPGKKELVLSGVNMDGHKPYSYSENPIPPYTGIKSLPYDLFDLPGGTTVIVKEGSVNTMLSRIKGSCFFVRNDEGCDPALTIKGGGTLDMYLSKYGIDVRGTVNIEDVTMNFTSMDVAMMTFANFSEDNATGEVLQKQNGDINFKNCKVKVKDCYGGFYTYGKYDKSGKRESYNLPTASINYDHCDINMKVKIEQGNERNHHCMLIRNGYLNIKDSNVKLDAYHEAVVVWRQYLKGEKGEKLINLTNSKATKSMEVAADNVAVGNSKVRGETFVNKDEKTEFTFEIDDFYNDGTVDMSFGHSFSVANKQINILRRCKVTLDTKGGMPVDDIFKYSGSKIGTLPVPKKENAKFLGWTTEQNSKNVNVDENMIVKDNMTIYAVWDQTFTITFDSMGGSAVEKRLVKDGAQIGKLPIPIREGYIFVGWTTKKDSTRVDVNEKTIPTGNATYYAIWKSTSISNHLPDANTPASNTINKVNPQQVEQLITSANTDKKDVAGSEYGKLMLKATGKKKSIKLSWKKISGASEYEIYGSACGKKMQKIQTVSGSKKSYTIKKLKAGKYYKYMVVAYKKVGTDKEVITASKSAHATTLGGKNGNPTKITGTKKTVTIKVKKTSKIKASIKKTKKVKTHIAKLRYESSNPNIATVSSKGVIKGKKKGNCVVYVYAQNGVGAKIKVKVK